MDALILAGVALLALWAAIVVGRKRAERRAEEARARAEARRVRVPLVSSNLRGQRVATPDLWRESVGAAAPEAQPPDAAPRAER